MECKVLYSEWWAGVVCVLSVVISVLLGDLMLVF
jgi:hypothetical protein